MTGITHIGGWNMVRRFTTGNGAIMTIKTRADDLRMIHRDGRDWCPGRREFLVTGIANISTGYMRCALATGRYPIVTSNTVTDKRGVINSKRRCPGIGSMAIVTFQRRLNMIHRLTGC